MWRPWKNIDGASSSVPAKKKHLSADAREIVKTIYSSLLTRGLTANTAASEISDLTKIPLTTVKRITSNPIKSRRKRKDAGSTKCIDENDKDLIRRKIYTMYEEQRIPTLDALKQRLTNDDTQINCSRISLWRILSKMGFRYRTIDKRQVLMESHRLQKWRNEYITSIRKYRTEDRPIIYLDETWFDTHATPSKGWSDSSSRCQTKAPSNKGKRITILHAGSENGWVPNALWLSAKNIKDSCVDYHEDTTAELFEEWFKNFLIPNLPQNSVIVMDNASYHSRQLHKSPSANNTKIEIQNYLLENDIYFEESYLKNELLEVLKSFSIKKVYVCDALAEEMGHTVLRLPPYYCLFNPIEHMWHQLKSNVRSQNVSPTLSGSVVELIRKCVDDISPESWKNSVRHVINVENSYVTLNHIIKPIVINFDEDSDSETELGI